MSKVTSKLQVTIPKAVADRYAIRAGSEILFEPAGEVVRLRPAAVAAQPVDVAWRCRVFDAATARQRARDESLRRDFVQAGAPGDRGWQREELYTRGVPG